MAPILLAYMCALETENLKLKTIEMANLFCADPFKHNAKRLHVAYLA